MSIKSGRGRLSSTNSLTEKTLRNCPCEYAAWSPSCQSPTCQSPAAIRTTPISNQSHGTLRLARSARNQGVSCLFAVENRGLRKNNHERPTCRSKGQKTVAIEYQPIKHTIARQERDGRGSFLSDSGAGYPGSA